MDESTVRELTEDRLAENYCAFPATIKSFDAAVQTVTAEVNIRRLNDEKIGLLRDVPIVLPTVQGFISSDVDVEGPTITLETHTHTYNPGPGAPTETSDGN